MIKYYTCIYTLAEVCLENAAMSTAKKLLLGTAIGAVLGLLGALSGVTAFALPMFLSFMFIAWGFAPALLCLAACLGLGGAMAGLPTALFMLYGGVPAAAVITFIIKKKLPWRTAVIACSFLMGIALFARFCAPSLLAGQDAFAAVKAAAVTLGEELSAATAGLDVDGRTSEMLTLFAVVLPDMIPSLAITAITTFAMAASLANVVVARVLLHKAGYKELKPMMPMQLWQLSPNFKYAAGAAAIGALACTIAGLNNATAVVALAEQIICGPLALMGFCYLDFSTRLGKPGSKSRRIIIYALVIILPYRTTVLAVVGLIDRALKFRRRFVPNKKKKQQ